MAASSQSQRPQSSGFASHALDQLHDGDPQLPRDLLSLAYDGVMEARIAIGAALLAGLLAADQPASSDEPRTCEAFRGLSEGERLLFGEGLYEGYTAAILRAMTIAEGAKQDDQATESTKHAGAGVDAFARTAGIRPVRLGQLRALLVAECLDPSTDPATPMSLVFATVATRLGPEKAAESAPHGARATPP